MDSFAMGPLPQYTHGSPLPHPDTHTGDDVYRGSFLPYRVTEGVAVDRVSTSSIAISSSTQSASTHLVRRALATVVELAILRWARYSSSTSSDSSSFFSVQHRSSRRQNPHQRHPRRSSISTIAVVNTTSIALAREAAERARRVPREFHLIFPAFQPPLYAASTPHILQTSSLSLALARLTSTLRQAHRARRDKTPRYSRTPAQLSNSQLWPSNAQDSDFPTERPGLQTDISTEHCQHHTRSKLAQTIIRPSIGTASWQAGGSAVGEGAWWLDVASPTWDDMRAIGTVNSKYFHAFYMPNPDTSLLASSSTPSHVGGCPSSRSTREARVLPETWLLFYSFSGY